MWFSMIDFTRVVYCQLCTISGCYFIFLQITKKKEGWWFKTKNTTINKFKYDIVKISFIRSSHNCVCHEECHNAEKMPLL